MDSHESCAEWSVSLVRGQISEVFCSFLLGFAICTQGGKWRRKTCLLVTQEDISCFDTRQHVFTGNSNIHIQLKSDDYVSFIRTIAKAPRRKLMSEGSSTRLGGGMGGGL